ncbi:invasion associated locus B family protein [Sphingomonas sp. Mn802worker]|uniref:invasion associated locus B family protein n=1 Tax=Sphingomonas sp. Mn802worker TaxID=629773 RepID=UPI00037E9D72|nr:invasion associated locus B family protein [Sphingomonas sp. Mn802worker]
MSALLLALALLAGEREAIGVWQRWGAIRDAGPPRRCFALTRPVTASGDTDTRGGFASVAARIDASGRQAVFVRFSAEREPGTPITLAIGERRFALRGDSRGARAPDAATDRAIVAAMRGGRSMSVSVVAAGKRPLADTYVLDGAATAIDAASLACAR